MLAVRHVIGNEPIGRRLWSSQNWCHLCEPIEKRQSRRQGTFAGETRRENIFAIQILVLQTRRTLPASSVQQIFGYTS